MEAKIKGEKIMSNKKGSAPPRYDEEFKKGAMALVTEKEKVQSFFGLSLFYASQILNGAVALFLLYTNV